MHLYLTTSLFLRFHETLQKRDRMQTTEQIEAAVYGASRLIPRRDLQIKFDVSSTTLWRWVRQGLFPKPVKLNGNKLMWLESEVNEWEQEQIEAR